MTKSPKQRTSNHANAKTLLSTLRLTTTIGAVSLSLAGWALLSRAEAINVAQAAQVSPSGFTGGAQTQSSQSSVFVRSASQLDSSGDRTPASVIAAARLRATPTSPVPTSPAAVATATSAPKTTVRALPTAPIPTATPGSVAIAAQAPAPTATPTPAPTATPTPAPTATPAPTPTTATKFKLDVVQWVQTSAGDPVAVVRDNRGVLWYVWGPDVDRIEQGLSPQYQPVPVNGVARSRHS